MSLALHTHKDISPLLKTTFDTATQELETLLDKHQKEAPTAVLLHMGHMVTNLKHLRIQVLLDQTATLQLMHLAGYIHISRPTSTVLQGDEFEQTKYRLLEMLVKKLDKKVLTYLMHAPQASQADITAFTDKELVPLFEAIYGSHKPVKSIGLEDDKLVHKAVYTLLE